MADSAFFMMRLNDHIQYLKKMEATLAGKKDFAGTTHTDCKLGKWLYGEEAQTEIAALQEHERAKAVFDSILEPHERFHSVGQDALDKKNSGDEAGAQVALTELHKLSAVLTNKLLELDGMK